MRVVLTKDTDLVPCVKVTVVRVLVVSPRVTEIMPTVKPLVPSVMLVLLQEMEVLPQEMAYLVLRNETLPLVKEVLLDEYVDFHSLLESFLDCFVSFGCFALPSDVFSI